MKFPISVVLAFQAIQLTSAFKDSDFNLPQEAYAPTLPISKVRHSHEYQITDNDLNQYPNITLDYGIHLPTLQNTDAGYILYKNIRYGQNPSGNLRWAPWSSVL